MLRVNSVNVSTYGAKPLDACVLSPKAKEPVGTLGFAPAPAACYRASFSTPSFCAKPKRGEEIQLLNRKTGEPVKALFIELEEKKDLHFVENLELAWADKTKWGDNMIGDFLKPSALMDKGRTRAEFYIVSQRLRGATRVGKTLCMMEVQNSPKDGVYTIGIIQNAPDLADNLESEIKGAGTMAIYSLAKLAKEKGYRAIEVCSDFGKEGFYKSLGFEEVQKTDPRYSLSEPNEGTPLRLKGSDFDTLLQKVEKKYKHPLKNKMPHLRAAKKN